MTSSLLKFSFHILMIRPFDSIFFVPLILLCFLAAGPMPEPPVFADHGDAQEGVEPAGEAHDEKAAAHLKGLSDFYKGHRCVQADMAFTAEISQAGQAMPPFKSKHRAAAKRPNLLALTRLEGETAGDTISDGDQWYMYLPEIKAYSKRPSMPTFSAMIQALEKSPTPSPGVEILIKIMSDDPEASLTANKSGLTYDGQETVAGKACHHLRMKGERGETHLWIGTGPKPWLRRYVQSFSQSAGPQGQGASVKMTVDFTNWSDADAGPSVFRISPPPDAKAVDDLFKEMAMQQADDQQKEQMQKAMMLVKKKAPIFEGDLLGGGKLRLSDQLGSRVIIMDFWATWCKPCIMAMPVMLEVTRAFGDEDLVFYSVNILESPDKVSQFMKEKGYTFPVVMDQTGAIAGLYNVGPIPHTVVIGRDGQVAHVHLGFVPDLKEQLTGEIKALLGAGDGL
jgi:peroxiredoxin